MRTTPLIALSLLTLLASAAASADPAGFHVGTAVGRALLDEQFDDGTRVDTDSTAFRFTLGYRFGDYLGLEAGYHRFGDFQQEVVVDGVPADVSIGADGFTAAVTGRVPLGERFSVLGRAGLYFWNGTAQINDVSSASPDDTNLLLGLGLGFRVASPLTLTADVSHYDLEDAESTVFSLGLDYRFGAR